MGEDRQSKFGDVVLHEDKLEDATDKQKAAMRLIDENWPTTFTAAAETGGDKGISDNESYYRKYFHEYFGPRDDKLGRTWDEIKDVYGSVSSYREHRYELDDIENETESPAVNDGGMQQLLSEYGDQKNKETILDMALDWAYERGVERGRELEREK